MTQYVSGLSMWATPICLLIVVGGCEHRYLENFNYFCIKSWNDFLGRRYKIMKIEEAILYCLASQNRGMRTEQIAEMINRQRLHLRKDGLPVTSNLVYAGVCRYPDMFVKTEGRIMLMI